MAKNPNTYMSGANTARQVKNAAVVKAALEAAFAEGKQRGQFNGPVTGLVFALDRLEGGVTSTQVVNVIKDMTVEDVRTATALANTIAADQSVEQNVAFIRQTRSKTNA